MYDSENDKVVQETLKCTPKCQTALTSDKTLTCRTRQYCLLLSRGDALSQQMSRKLSTKVDVPALLQADYLESDNLEFNEFEASNFNANTNDAKFNDAKSNNESETISFEPSHSDDNLTNSSNTGLFKQYVNSAQTQQIAQSLEDVELSPSLQWIEGNY